MNSSKINKQYHFLDLLACGIILFSPIGNLALQNSALGIMGATASFPFALIAVAILVINKALKLEVSKQILWPIAYAIVITLIYSLLINKNINSENAHEKGVKIFIYYTLTVSIALVHVKNIDLIRHFFRFALILSAISLFRPLSEISFLNYLGSNEGRPRGLTIESSHFALVVGIIALTLFHLENSRLAKQVSTVVGLLLILYSQSKGGVLIYCVVLFVYYAQEVNKSKSKLAITLTILASFLALVIVAIPFFIDRISNDIDRYTSTATRTVGLVSAIQIAFSNPFGVGFTGYTEYYLASIPRTIIFVKNYFPSWDFSEVIQYINQKNTNSIGTKSYFADSIIIFGWPFLFFYLYFFKYLYQTSLKTRNTTLIPGILFSLFGLTFWSAGMGFYVLFMFLALARTTVRSKQ